MAFEELIKNWQQAAIEPLIKKKGKGEINWAKRKLVDKNCEKDSL